MKSSRILYCVILGIVTSMVFGCGDDDLTEPDNGKPGIITVKPDGSGDYPTIQAAINAAKEGNTIELADGIFTGEDNRDMDFRGKAITLQSKNERQGSTVIDCQRKGRGFYFHFQEEPDTVVKGITVTNGFASSGGGALCTDRSSPTIVNCIFINNSGPEAGGGMLIHDNSSPAITNCVFSGNSTEASGGGVYCSESTPTFTGCTFWNNTAGAAGGMSIFNSSLKLVSCTITGNRPNGIVCGESSVTAQNTIITFSLKGQAVSCYENCSFVLTCSNIYGNADGDWIECISDQHGRNGNISKNPLFRAPENGDFHLQLGSPCNADSSLCGLIGAWGV